MPRFLTPEWVAAFNRALSGIALEVPDSEGSLVAAGGTFRVAQVVHGVPGADGVPGGDLGTVLVVADGSVSLALGRGTDPADVTVSLSYADAADLSRGTLSPADALAEGRVRVRGDLSVLVAGQQLLAAASPQLAGLHADTTY